MATWELETLNLVNVLLENKRTRQRISKIIVANVGCKKSGVGDLNQKPTKLKLNYHKDMNFFSSKYGGITV